ncbi:MAG: alpha/beta hydrolase [Corynebacteriales bacterium]|nr:alpha/beta hydrolase [Mycobacteriales bacterium]
MNMGSALKGAGVAGALVGVAALGAAVGVFGERYALRRIRKAKDPHADERFGALPADETRTVRTDDGVELHVEVMGPPGRGKPINVVFVHGFCLNMGTWHFQRLALDSRVNPSVRDALGDIKLRLVFYDQPGHGRSDRRAANEYTLDQLAEDLHTVLEQVCPRGPLVLLGHSMGGMTLMALAERYPKLFADRVVGVGLLSTSAGHLDDVALGMPRFMTRLRKPLMPTIAGTLKSHPKLGELGRMSGTDLAYLMTRYYGFGSRSPSTALVEFTEQMIESTSMEVIAGYLGTLAEHDRSAALRVFERLETLIVCGNKDRITPVAHTKEMAEFLPAAELLQIPDGGHLTLLEHHERVNEHLVAFLARAAYAVS